MGWFRVESPSKSEAVEAGDVVDAAVKAADSGHDFPLTARGDDGQWIRFTEQKHVETNRDGVPPLPSNESWI